MVPRRFPIAFALALAGATPAAAGEVIDVFGDWSAFRGSDLGRSYCYIGSLPQKQEGNFSRRGEVLVLVTHRPAEKSFDVVSIQAGFPYKDGSEAEVVIGGQAIQLFTSGETAWAYDDKADKALVAAMKAGATMVVRGTSGRGNVITDTYSLDGFTAAYQAIAKACEAR